MPEVNRYYSSTAIDTTLSFSIAGSDLTFTIGSVTGLPTSYPYTLALGYDLNNEELVTIVAASGTLLTVGVTVAGGANIAGRGIDGTSAQAHVAGEAVKHVVTARDMTEAQAHIAAEAAAHGITGTFVGTTDTQTLINKTLTAPKINENVAVTATATELNYVDGVTSNIQTQITTLTPQTVRVYATEAARSSAIPTPTEGMTSYNQTTDQLEAYNGSAWVGMSGLIPINTTSFTNAATVQINGCFTSIYDNYMFELRFTQNTTAGNLYYQNSLGGTPAPTDYIGNGYSVYGAGLSGVLFTTAAAASKLYIGNITAGQDAYIVSHISNPALAAQTLYSQTHEIGSSGAGTDTAGFIGGRHYVATAYDGMTLTVDAGTMTGTIRIYGLRNS